MTIDAGRGFDSDLSIQAASATTWRLIAPLIWTGSDGDTFMVPVGFVTDFATIPRFMQGQFSPYGPYTRAAVLHDWLIEHRINAADPAMRVASRDVDGIFRRVMHDLGVPAGRRWVMWAGVRWGALFSSRRAYGRAFARDAWRVGAISVLALPVILPGALGNLLSAALAWPFTRIKPSPLGKGGA